MRKKRQAIPINPIPDESGTGIIIGTATADSLYNLDQEMIRSFEKVKLSHRDDHHLFFILERGSIKIEIDFQQFDIKPLSVIYIHPNEVHRLIAFEDVMVSMLAIRNENLRKEYLNLLEDITPANPLPLDTETFALLSEAISLGIKCSERNHEKLYPSLLNDSCNTLAGLIISQYLGRSRSMDKLSRFEIITRSFKAILENNFTTAKRPAEYAKRLNITTIYLNECVKNTTGYSVTHHIRQRIILEARRLLYHSDKSVKEIAAELGYDDYPYFSRLFTNITGISASAFRNKNPR